MNPETLKLSFDHYYPEQLFLLAKKNENHRNWFWLIICWKIGFANLIKTLDVATFFLQVIVTE